MKMICLLWSLVVMIVFGWGQRLSFFLLTEWVQKSIAVQGSPSFLTNKVRSWFRNELRYLLYFEHLSSAQIKTLMLKPGIISVCSWISSMTITAVRKCELWASLCYWFFELLCINQSMFITFCILWDSRNHLGTSLNFLDESLCKDKQIKMQCHDVMQWKEHTPSPCRYLWTSLNSSDESLCKDQSNCIIMM